MKVRTLIEQLQGLPQDKSIMCQVIPAKGPGAWNMHFDFHDVPNSWMVQLAVHHPELQELPKVDAWERPPVRKVGALAVVNAAVHQARGIANDHPGSVVLASHLSDLIRARDSLAGLLEVSKRALQECEGTWAYD